MDGQIQTAPRSSQESLHLIKSISKLFALWTLLIVQPPPDIIIGARITSSGILAGQWGALLQICFMEACHVGEGSVLRSYLPAPGLFGALISQLLCNGP